MLRAFATGARREKRAPTGANVDADTKAADSTDIVANKSRTHVALRPRILYTRPAITHTTSTTARHRCKLESAVADAANRRRRRTPCGA